MPSPVPPCPAWGGAARGQQSSLPALPVEQQPWHCCSLGDGQGMVLLQNLLQKNPNRQWEVPYHGWFLGGFGGWFWFFVWFSLVCFGVFLRVGFEAEPGVYWPPGVGKGTPWSCEIPALLCHRAEELAEHRPSLFCHLSTHS